MVRTDRTLYRKKERKKYNCHTYKEELNNYGYTPLLISPLATMLRIQKCLTCCSSMGLNQIQVSVGGMWQPLRSATNSGIFMSSSSLRKHMTLPAIWHPKNSSCSGSQTGMTDRLVVALHPAKQFPTESFSIWNLSPPGTSCGLKYIEQCSLFTLHCIQHLLRTLYF